MYLILNHKKYEKIFVSNEDGTAVFALDFSSSVGVQMFLLLRRKSRTRAPELPLSRTSYDCQRRHSPTESDLATPHAGKTSALVALWRPKEALSNTVRTDIVFGRYHCLSRVSRLEGALSDAFRTDNALCWSYPCFDRLSRWEAVFSDAVQTGNRWSYLCLSQTSWSKEHFSTKPGLSTPRVEATPASIILCGQRQHTWTHLELASLCAEATLASVTLCGQRWLSNASWNGIALCWSYFCLGRTSRSEAALSDEKLPDNALRWSYSCLGRTLRLETALSNALWTGIASRRNYLFLGRTCGQRRNKRWVLQETSHWHNEQRSPLAELLTCRALTLRQQVMCLSTVSTTATWWSSSRFCSILQRFTGTHLFSTFEEEVATSLRRSWPRDI